MISPEKTFQRHWSTSRPNGQERDLVERLCSSRPMSFDGVGLRVEEADCFRYAGVTDSAIVSPMASWKPSLALSRKRKGCLL